MKTNRFPIGPALRWTLLAALLWSVSRVRAAEPPVLLVRVADLKREVTYVLMTPAEFKELEKETALRTRLFSRAMELAQKEWRADASLSKLPFPAGRLSPPVAQVMERPATREQAERRLRSLEEREADRREQDAKKAETAKEKERERHVQRAFEMVQDKLNELIAREKKRLTPDIPMPRPDAETNATPHSPDKQETGAALDQAL